jgi:E3 ubiquitin-protein ligase SHPRH
LTLPSQTDQTFYIKFSSVEDQFYQDLFNQALQDIGPPPAYPELDQLSTRDKKKATEKYEQACSLRISKMHTWFLRIRQTCCHPQISSHAKKDLGKKKLHTMTEVLEAMLVRSISAIQSTERSMVATVIERGQVFENISLHNEAISVYQSQVEFVGNRVKEMEQEYERLKSVKECAEENDENFEPTKELESEAVSRCKLNLNLWRELMHKLLFFMASCHHVLKNQELETDLYKLAANMREIMLAEFSINFCRARDTMKTSFISVIGEFRELESVDLKGGLITDRLFEEVRYPSPY